MGNESRLTMRITHATQGPEAGEASATCQYCGEPYKPAKAWQKFCREACRAAFHREGRREVVRGECEREVTLRCVCGRCKMWWVIREPAEQQWSICPHCGTQNHFEGMTDDKAA